jgi:hypothetical protein
MYSKILPFFATTPFSHNTPHSHFMEESQAMRDILRVIGNAPGGTRLAGCFVSKYQKFL